MQMLVLYLIIPKGVIEQIWYAASEDVNFMNVWLSVADKQEIILSL